MDKKKFVLYLISIGMGAFINLYAMSRILNIEFHRVLSTTLIVVISAAVGYLFSEKEKKTKKK